MGKSKNQGCSKEVWGCVGAIGAALVTGMVALIIALPTLIDFFTPATATPPIVSVTEISPISPNANTPPRNEPTNSVASPATDPSTSPGITDTPAGTILEVGQTWRQGGLELRLDKGEVTLGDEYREHGPGVLIGFSLTNRRPQQITFQITQENFFASDNRGRQLEVGKVNPFYGYYFAPPMDDVPINLQSGERIELYYDYDAFFVRDDITDPSVTEIIIGATGISSIDNARWRIPIFH